MMTLSLLVVDDDPVVRETLVEFFETCGYSARGAATAAEGRRLAQEHAPDVVVLDLRLPDADGIQTLEALRADDPDIGFVLLTGHADVRTAVRAMQSGADDVLEKPVSLDVLAKAIQRAAQPGRLRQELAVLRAQVRRGSSRDSSPLDHSLEQLIEIAARNTDAPVLIQGETGTGKGFVAKLIHERSVMAAKPFIEVNCASLSATFFESDLFGHERGAFTDARQAKRGLLEIADDGTVFLDEIAELSLDVQPRLLKVLEERTFRRLGGTIPIKTRARIIVATNQPLGEAVAQRRFRADLYYRLQVLTLTLPSLRDRPQDVVPLARSFLPRGAELSQASERVLTQYPWPGNIRELKNTIWRAAILADSGQIAPQHLQLSFGEALATPNGEPAPDSAATSLVDLEIEAIRAALLATKGNRSKSARQLGIARSTLLEKIKKYGL